MLTPLILKDPAPDPPSKPWCQSGTVEHHGGIDTPQFVGAGAVGSIVVKLSDLQEVVSSNFNATVVPRSISILSVV